MGWYRGMNLVTNGLVCYYDPMNPKSYGTYNLLQYTEDFTNSYWLKSASSISANVITAPDGTLTADKITENTANSSHKISIATPVPYENGDYTASIYVKAAERTGCMLQISDNVASTANMYCNLLTGTFSTNTTGTNLVKPTGSITLINNGWFLISITATKISGSNLIIQFYNTVNDSPGYVGTVGYGIYAWGVQLNRGKRTLPYQPVLTTSPVSTLSYDLIGRRVATASNAPIVNSSEGSYLFNGTNQSLETNFFGSNTDSYTVDTWCYIDILKGNPIIRGQDSNGGWSIIMASLTGFFVVVNSAQYGASATASTTDLNRWVNMVGTYDRTVGRLNFYLDGVLKSTTTCPVNGTLRSSTKGFIIGRDNGTTPASHFQGRVGPVKIYNRVLTQDEITQNYKNGKSRYT